MALNLTNISNYTDLLRGFQGVIENYLKRFVATVTFCEIVGVHQNGARVDVKNLMQNVDGSNAVCDNEIIPDIPVMMMRGGGSVITFDIIPGDIGLLIACKNDITEIKKQGGTGGTLAGGAQIASDRNFSFSDGVFLPFNFGGGVSGCIKIENKDSTILIKEGGVEIKSSKLKIKGDVEIDGILKVKKEIKSDGDILAGEISLKNHTHQFINFGGILSKTKVPE